MNPEHRVSAIVPARNEEANIGPAVRSLAAQPEIAEILVVNDQSVDGTARVLLLLRGEPAVASKLKVLETDAELPARLLPEGWVGKNYAVWLGAQHAVSPWLLFTDADAVHLEGSMARALAAADASGAGMISYSPAQEMRTWWERALIPFVFCRLSQLYSYGAVNDPQTPAAAANGQYLLVRRDAYDQIGGHAAVAGEILEDVALAKRAKEAGVVLHFAPDDRIARVRMYASFHGMWEGWTKNLSPLIENAGQTVPRELFSVLPWIPLACFLLIAAHPAFGALGLLLLAGRHASYAAMLRRNRFPVGSVRYYLVAMALYVAALLVSDWHYARGKVVWKGRQYAVRHRSA